MMLQQIIKKYSPSLARDDRKLFDEKISKLSNFYPGGRDAWGLNLKSARQYLELIYPLYRDYFKVRTFGQENVEDRSYMIVSNHSGQIAIDGLLLGTAFAMSIEPPRIIRPMVERFFTGLPFVGHWATECGAVLGDRQNCINLLNKGNSVLVFPEGVSGVAKSTTQFYNLQRFTQGFYRLALLTQTPILPVAVIGAEEFFPFVYQAKGLAKLFGLPACPVSANYIPLPSPVDIHIGKPIMPSPDLSKDASENQINEHVYQIEGVIRNLIEKGLSERRDFWANRK